MRSWIGGGNSLIILLLLQILGGEAWATPNADLIQAIQEKHVEGVRQALENGADVNVRDEGQGVRTFEYYLDVVHCLDTILDLGGMTSLIPEEGLPPLLVAMQSQDSEVHALVELLLHYGADVNASVPDEHFEGVKKGWTALITAAYHDDLKLVELLLHHGADVTFTVPEGSHAGDSALLMAEAHKNPEMIELLTQAGATPLDPDQQTKALHMRKERFATRRFHAVHCGGRESRCLEEHDMSYELYTLLGERLFLSISLPKEAEHIDWFLYGEMFFADNTYEFVQARVKPADIDLKHLVTECIHSDSDEAFLLENAPFSMEGFHRVFIQDDTMIPQWWTHGTALQDFPVNIVACNENDSGRGGSGCWAFYHDKTHMLRVFWWAKTQFSVQRLCNTFQIERCKDGGTLVQEDDALIPAPPCTPDTLQQLVLHSSQITEIIVGRLGNYARVQTPDGSCMIEVGTRIGKNAGHVVEISEKVVRVREYIQDAKGAIGEVETILYLNPLEE